MNQKNYLAHVLGFLSLSALAVFPWVGILPAASSIAWARWANSQRATFAGLSASSVKRATATHMLLCVVMQVAAIYQLHSKSHELIGVFGAAQVAVVAAECVALVFMFFRGWIVKWE